MANLTAGIIPKPVGALPGRWLDWQIKASTSLFRGGLVACLLGQLVPFTTANAGPAIGMLDADFVGGAADGDKRAQFETDRVFILANAGDIDATIAFGAPLFGTDDHTVAASSSSGTRPLAGFFDGLEVDATGTAVGVRVLVCARDAINGGEAALVAALTATAVAGAASDGTLVAMPDPTDTPATADALRDDLVAVLIPSIRNNIQELADKQNAVIAALKAAGIMSTV